MKIWQRYFIKETLKMVFTVLITFYLLFILIDYSLHTKALQDKMVPLHELMIYYLSQFSKRAHLLIPFALMLSFIKVLTSLNLRGELVALLAGGIPLKKLWSPFLLIAALFTVSLFANYQFCYPIACKKTDQFESLHYGKAKSFNPSIYAIQLKDDTTLVYRNFSQETKTFCDLFWIKSMNEVIHIQKLNFENDIAVGYQVDHMARNEEGLIEKVASFSKQELPYLQIDKSAPLATTPPEQHPLSDLWKHRPHTNNLSDQKAKFLSLLHFKLATPLACFLMFIGPAPFCIRFGRKLPIFLIYALSIVGFLSYLTTMDAALILGESHVFYPIIIWVPLLAGYGLSMIKFLRI